MSVDMTQGHAMGVAMKRKEDPRLIQGRGRYLDDKFGENLGAVRKAMMKLAGAYPPGELAEQADRLYERFRPSVPERHEGVGCEGRFGPGGD